MFRTLIVTAAIAVGTTSAAQAQEWYVGGSIGALSQDDSSNSGSTGAFTTGNGAPAVPNGTAVAAGTPYGWNTEFEDGMAASAEVGLRYGGGLRSGLELAYSKADVDRHSGVQLGGTVIDGVDAAVLTGSATQLGATVGAVVDDGRGEIVVAAGKTAGEVCPRDRPRKLRGKKIACLKITKRKVPCKHRQNLPDQHRDDARQEKK